MSDISTIPTRKLWNPKSFIIISVLFSFLPAGIMYSLNYGRCGNQRKKWAYLISTIVGFIALYTLAFIIPTIISKSISFGINIAIGAYLMNTQTPLYKQHIQNGGKRSSYFLPITIGVLIFTLIISSIIYTQHIPDKALNYNKNKLFYTENVTESQAKKLGDYLEAEDFFKVDSETDVKVDKQKDIFIFSMVIKKDYIDNEDVLDNMKLVSKELSVDVFENNKVQIDLCTNRFKVLKSISSD